MNRRDFLLCAAAASALPALPAAAQRRFTSQRISVETRGTGSDVILIPGLSSGRGVWASTVAALPGHRYHLVQVNGFAGSAAEGNDAGPIIAPVAAEIARYISEMGLKAPAIVGHSMGGTLAMMLAARYPARVGRVMAVDITPQPAGLFGADAASIGPLADSLMNLFGSSPGGRRLIETAVAQYGGGWGAGSDSGVVARAAHELARLDLTPELPKIKAPLHVVYALPPRSDAVDPARIDRSVRAAYAGAKGAKLVPIANSGHMVMLDQPARFQAALKAFLA